MNKNPLRGEIWLVSFDPQVAEEIKKTRPAVVLTIKELRHLPIRTVVPIRHFEDYHEEWFHMVTIEPNKTNNLDKKSSVDCSQVKAFALVRLIKKLGNVSKKELELITDTTTYCIGKI